MPREVVVVASGDLRLSANRVCWPAQQRVEEAPFEAVRSFGFEPKRAHSYDSIKQHGFIDSQKRGMEVFRTILADAPLVVVGAVWQYSHHVLARLTTTKSRFLRLPTGVASGRAWSAC